MERSDFEMQFAIATTFVVAGLGPIVVGFEPVIRVLGRLEQSGARWPTAFVANAQGVGTAALAVVACVLSLAVGLTLALVTFGRFLDREADATARKRPQPVRG